MIMVEKETEIDNASLGERLRECREKKNLSIAEVAAQMHLDSKIIRIIEEDDYDSMPDPIYVRGYIRNYCKILEQNADEILELFKKNAVQEDPELIPEIKYPSQTSSSDKPVKAITYLLSLGLVLLVIAWWQSNFIIKSTPTIETNSSQDESLSISTTTAPEEIAIDDSNQVPDTPVNNLDNVADEPVDFGVYTDTTDIDSNETQPIENITDTSLQVDEIRSALTRQEDEEPVFQESYLNPDNSEQTVSAPSFGPDSLIINLMAESWIEIYDINGQRVYIGLGSTGEKLNLLGTAPFNILLGYGRGVTIEFNGTAIEQIPISSSGVARLILGE